MDKIEQRICEIIDSRKDEIIAFGSDIFNHAEIGYREFRTAEKFNAALKALGLEVEEGLAITGAKGYLNGKGAEGVTVALMGELDALPISNARHSNPETGCAHCCGHNAQLTGVLGAAMALTDPEIKAALDGNVVFFSVPAEEYVDIEYRNGLRDEGKARYGGGKCEMIRVGGLDDIDVTVGHHSTPLYDIGIRNSSSNGLVSKVVKFKGKSSHAAGSPHVGIDALNASAIAQSAIQFQRESFQDKDTVRVHYILTKAGEAVNVIADDVRMEFLVRAGNIPAIKDASYKVNRALKAGALATGCGIEIDTAPGYAPTVPLPVELLTPMDEAINDVMAAYDGELKRVDAGVAKPNHGTGSTDYGDISLIMPLYQFATGGFSGIGHNPNYDESDTYIAYVMTAKLFALMAYKLLKNGAEWAKKAMDGYKVPMTKEEYLAYMESMMNLETMDLTPVPEFE